jgi:hypothetical protein
MKEKYYKILRHYINSNDCATVIKQLLSLHNVVVPKGALPNNCNVCGRTVEEMGKMTSMCGVSDCPNY